MGFNSEFKGLIKLEFLDRFSKIPKLSNFHKNPSSGSRIVPCGRTDMMKLIVAFRNFAKAPKMYIGLHVKYPLFLPSFNET